MSLDLTDPFTRSSFDAMQSVAARRLSPEMLAEWHHRIAAAADLDQASDITSEMVGLPMTDEDRRIAREVRASLALLGDQL